MAHWSDKMTCSCGKSFRSYTAEARHRHNFPLLCRPAKRKAERPSRPLARPSAAGGESRASEGQSQ